MKKILIGLIVLLSLLLIPTSQAVAETVEDSFYEGEYVPGEYITKFNGSTGRYQQMKFFRRRSDNQAVYCIELWKPLLSDHPMTGYQQNQALYANIDESIFQRIMLIAYYGYGYGNHMESKWYAITQFMIWKETTPGGNFYFTNGLNGNKITKYEREMAEINELIEKHNHMIPSFHNQTFQAEYLDDISITDENHVLEKFDVVSSPGLSARKDENQITIHVAASGTNSVMLEHRDQRFSVPTIVYVDDIGQNLLAPGSYQPISAVVNFQVPTTDFTVLKVDQETNVSVPQGDASLAGSVFQLIDKNGTVVASEEIASDGKLVFKEVGYGNYTVKEVKAGTGYSLNQQSYPVHVTDGVEELVIPNQVILNTITITKYLQNPITGVSNTEVNATFSIYNQNHELVKEVTTNEMGMVDMVLPYGTYTVHQTAGVKNHYFVEDFVIQVIEDGVHQEIPLYNIEKTSYVKVKNVDSDTMLPILEKGAIFRIKNLTTNEYIQDDMITNEQGKTSSILLSSGYYQLEQVLPVEGYLVNTEVFPFEITDDNYQSEIEIIVPNDKIQNTITIIKYMKNPITEVSDLEANATFSIYNQNHEVIREVTTNHQGIIEMTLPYGTYTVSQTAGVKNHYFVDDFTIQVTEDGVHQEFPLYNIEKTSYVKVKNVDSDTMLSILEKGAIFRIKNLTTNEYIQDDMITNEQGKTSSILLSSGYYQLEQALPVDGYLVSTEVFPFEITDDNYQSEIEIIVPNDKMKSRIVVKRYTDYFLDHKLVYTEHHDNIKVNVFAKNDLYSKDGVKIYDKDELVDTAYYKDGVVTTEKLVLGTYYVISPVDYQMIEIVLNSADIKKVDLVDQKYKFTENNGEITEETPTPEDPPSDEKNEEIQDVPPVPDEDEDFEKTPIEIPEEMPDKGSGEESGEQSEEEIKNPITVPIYKQEVELENTTTNSPNGNLVIVVPNTDSHQENVSYVGSIFLFIGFILIRRKNKNEKN